MLFRVGPGNAGYNYTPEFQDFDCTVSIPASGSLVQGQVVMRDVTLFPSTSGADHCVLPTSANAGPVYGVYQGPTIVNPSSTAALVVPVLARREGYGVVSCVGTTNVTVGGFVVIGVALQATGSAAFGTSNTQIGTALATGAVTAKAGIILTGAATGLVNCAINVAG